MKFRELKQLAQCHTISRSKSWVLNPVCGQFSILGASNYGAWKKDHSQQGLGEQTLRRALGRCRQTNHYVCCTDKIALTICEVL